MPQDANLPRRATARRAASKQARLLALLLIGAGLLAGPAYRAWLDATAPRDTGS